METREVTVFPNTSFLPDLSIGMPSILDYIRLWSIQNSANLNINFVALAKRGLCFSEFCLPIAIPSEFFHSVVTPTKLCLFRL